MKTENEVLSRLEEMRKLELSKNKKINSSDLKELEEGVDAMLYLLRRK